MKTYIYYIICVYTHWQYICIMYYAIYLRKDIHVLYNISTWRYICIMWYFYLKLHIWLAEGGNTCLKEVLDVRDDSKALIRTIAYCLNSNARLRPLRQCLLTMPYLRTTSGRFLSSDQVSYVYSSVCHASAHTLWDSGYKFSHGLDFQ